jgi:hypothetical protein
MIDDAIRLREFGAIGITKNLTFTIQHEKTKNRKPALNKYICSFLTQKFASRFGSNIDFYAFSTNTF